MPIYEYQCAQCGYKFSQLQKLGEGNEHLVCPKCHSPKPVRVFSAFATSSHGTTKAPGTGFT